MAFGFSRRAVIGLIGAVAVLLAQGVAFAAGLSGSYRVDGRNPDGTPYSGSVQIVETGNSVAMTWQVGGQSYQGNGRREGVVLAVDWGDVAPVIYVVMPNGELHGTWARGRALELLTPNR